VTVHAGMPSRKFSHKGANWNSVPEFFPGIGITSAIFLKKVSSGTQIYPKLVGGGGYLHQCQEKRSGMPS
jgi:hypothetical protein